MPATATSSSVQPCLFLRRVLLADAAVSTACGALMAFGAVGTVAVFLQPIAAEFAWPRADVAAAYSVATVATGLGGIALGHFADRLPVRRVALLGALVPGVAFMLLSGLETTPALYALHAVMGLAGIGAIMAPLNRLASLWLARNPGLAIGIVSAGGALGGKATVGCTAERSGCRRWKPVAS